MFSLDTEFVNQRGIRSSSLPHARINDQLDQRVLGPVAVAPDWKDIAADRFERSRVSSEN